jgi:ribosome biogenesis protein NSA1
MFKGAIGGGLRSIQFHPTAPLVLSCGLDRHLRVHSTETRKLVHKVGQSYHGSCLL